MDMLRHPAVLLWLTVTAYWLVNIVRARTGNVLFNPVMCTTALVIIYLKLCGIDCNTARVGFYSTPYS